MNPSVSRDITARTIPGVWAFMCYVFIIVAAIALATPDAHAKDNGLFKVKGKVTDMATGKKIKGATVTLTSTSGTETLTTNKKGKYKSKVPPGQYTIEISYPDYISQSKDVDVTDTTVVVDAALEPVGDGGGGSGVTLSGMVTNKLTGQGIEGASVTLSATGFTVSLTTDSQGNYSEDLAPGVYTMDVSASNFTDSSQSISLLSFYNSQSINLLSGPVVVDVPLEPVANVVVTASVGVALFWGGIFSVVSNVRY